MGVDENDDLIDHVAEAKLGYGEKQDFAGMILDHLKTSGVQQAHKEDRISFSGIRPWPGELVCAEGTYFEGDTDSGAQKRAGIFIGPEFGTVARPDLVQAAREAADAGFDVLIACAFNYEAYASEFNKLGRIPILKARMNADLHMADDLKNTGKGNLFVIFGEPDIDILNAEGSQIQVKVNGVDVYSTPTPAKSAATTPTALLAGSSIPTTTRKASSYGTPIFSVRATRTNLSKQPSRLKSTKKPGRRYVATPPAPLTDRPLDALQ